jgi:predicted nuclease of predicted toxin-antitoxin system
MKFLADVGILMSTVRALRERGYDAVHLREQGLQRLPDPEILKKAAAEGRIVLTFDLDFGDLLALGIKQSPSAVIFRLHDETPASVNPRLLEVLNDRKRELEKGALIIVEDNRYRMRRLPIEE